MFISTKKLFDHAYSKYAIGAYNINNAEQIMGLFQGNVQSKAPFIVQISRGARKYTDKRLLEAMIKAAQEIFPQAVFALHLDHGDEETCMECIHSGFYNSVMIDASDKAFEENIAITKRVVEAAHQKEIAVEAELGRLGGVEEDVSVEEGNAHLTDPYQAQEFIQRTACDSLACAIGTSHGAYKFTGNQSLRFEVIEKIQELVPGFPLVMHGSSAVAAEEVERINNTGGNLQGTKGVDEKELRRAAQMGVVKVNIDTDGRLVWCRVHREYFRDFPEVFDLRKPGRVFMEEYAKHIVQKNEMLGSANQAEKIL